MLAFHKSTTLSLTENVFHIKPDPYQHLVPLTLSSNVVIYNSPNLINITCLHLLNQVSNDNSDNSCLVIGFDIEYEVESTGQGKSGDSPKA